MTDITKLTDDQLIQLYREGKRRIDEQFKPKMAEIKGKMDAVAAELQRRMQANDIQNVRCKHGTAYRVERMSATVEDWRSFYDFVQTTDNGEDFLERRCSKSAVEAFMEANEDIPPGVRITRSEVVQVRKS